MLTDLANEINANNEQELSDSAHPNELHDIEWEIILSFLSIEDIISVNSTCKSCQCIIQKSTYLAHRIISEFLRVSQFPQNPHDAEETEAAATGDDMDIHVSRPFIIPLFSRMCLGKMSLFPETPMFQIYSRLLSYNWRIYLVWFNSMRPTIWERIKTFIFGNNMDNSFKLLNVFQNKHLFHFRELNNLETRIFIADTSLAQHTNFNINCNNKPIVDNMDTFIEQLHHHFYYKHWKHFIFDDTNKLFLAGGSVLKCIQKINDNDVKLKYSSKKMQDLDFFAIHASKEDFIKKIKKIVSLMERLGATVVFKNNFKNEQHIQNVYVNFSENKSVISNSLIDKSGGVDEELFEIVHKTIEEEGFWTDLQFIYLGLYEHWSVLHLFDLDCCQIGFDGAHVLCTYAFLQSINTQTMINYKLTNNTYLINTIAKRSIKYSGKGFNLICPMKFDIDILKELQKYESRDVDIDERVEETREWRKARHNALKQCKRRSRHAWFTRHAIEYGDGGFGLNNDYFGVRRIFAKLVEEGVSDGTFEYLRDSSVSSSESDW
eukprot:151287_1